MVTGPFAGELRCRKTIWSLKAARALAKQRRGAGAAICARQELPVASGIGGGRPTQRRRCGLLTSSVADRSGHAEAVAPSSGSDVPACLLSLAARGEGAGDQLTPIDLAGASRNAGAAGQPARRRSRPPRCSPVGRCRPRSARRLARGTERPGGVRDSACAPDRSGACVARLSPARPSPGCRDPAQPASLCSTATKPGRGGRRRTARMVAPGDLPALRAPGMTGRPILTAEAMRAAESGYRGGTEVEELMERAGAPWLRPLIALPGRCLRWSCVGPATMAETAMSRRGILRSAACGCALPRWPSPKSEAAKWARRSGRARSKPCPTASRPLHWLSTALFGTGLKQRTGKCCFQQFFYLATEAAVSVACDLPSGVDADSGACLSTVPNSI